MSDSQLSKPAVRQRRRRVRSIARVLVALFLLAVVAAAAVTAVGWYRYMRPENDIVAGKTVVVTIPRGSGTAFIASTLVDAGVVPNSSMFRWRARRSGVDGRLKAGEYKLTTGMPYDLVLERLQKGPEIVTFEVSIPEGFTARQIAARFAKRARMDEATLLKLLSKGAEKFSANHPYLKGAYGGSMEGFLFPATYLVKEGTDEKAAVEMMLKKFDAEIAKVDMAYAKSKNLTVTDVVIIASMIERETKLAKEFPLVSSVMYNRLKIRMRLQIDATVLYGLPPGTTTIMKRDLKNDDPYNTYSKYGLPVGPISNPGAKALDAAAHPATTTYYYYVLTRKDGAHTFTKDYADFLEAKKVYKRVFGQ